MKVFVVLYENYQKREVNVLEVYSDESKARARVGFERSMIEGNPDKFFRNGCWYEVKEMV